MLNLNKIENKIDKLLQSETKTSLTNFLIKNRTKITEVLEQQIKK